MSTVKAIKVSRVAKNKVASVTRICWMKDKTNAMNVIAHAVCIKKIKFSWWKNCQAQLLTNWVSCQTSCPAASDNGSSDGSRPVDNTKQDLVAMTRLGAYTLSIRTVLAEWPEENETTDANSRWAHQIPNYQSISQLYQKQKEANICVLQLKQLPELEKVNQDYRLGQCLWFVCTEMKSRPKNSRRTQNRRAILEICKGDLGKGIFNFGPS